MASRQTEFEVLYELIDVNAKNDSTLSATNIKNFGSDLELLEEDEPTYENSKNLLQYPYKETTQTINGLTFTDEGDGRIIVNGTATDQTDFLLEDISTTDFHLDYGRYTLTGCAEGGGENTFQIFASRNVSNVETVYGRDYGQGVTFNVTDPITDTGVVLRIENGVHLNNVEFKPMLRVASDTDDTWYPYSKKSQFKETLTLEHNFSALDGTLPEFPLDTSAMCYFSDSMSDANGEWESGEEPTLTATFTRTHSTFSLTLEFLDTEPKTVEVTWYTGAVVIAHDTFNISGEQCYIQKDVENYNKIEFKFLKTTPYHYVKFTTLYYGMKLVWNENNVKTGKMTKEINPISDKIPIDTMSFEVIDVNIGQLNLGNMSGLHRFFQRKQPMHAREYIDGKRIDLGKFYLKTFANGTNLGKMSCVSYMDIFDNMQFADGALYDGIYAGTLLTQIFTSAGITNYYIDNATYSQQLYGTLKPQTYRNAIKEILFACQSIIDTSNPDKITIRKKSTTIRDNIGRDIKFSTTVTKKEYISGVEIKYSTFNKKDASEELVKNTEYGVGKHRVTFNNLVDPTTITFSDSSKLTDITTKEFYVEFTATELVTLTISGISYEEVKNSATVNRRLDAGEIEKIKSFNSTLCNYETAIEAATHILNYYKKDLELKIKALAQPNVDELYDMWFVENASANYSGFICDYDSRNLDLTGGFIEDSKLYGIYDNQAGLYYAGNELIANDNRII